MKKSVLFMAFISLVIGAKSQTIANDPKKMYALGYTYGKKVYDLMVIASTSTNPQPTLDQASNIMARKADLYDQIMETYHAPTVGNAFEDGYLNGYINTGRTTVTGSSYTYTAPANGSALNGLITYDASILFPFGTNHSNFMSMNIINLAAGGNSVTITFDRSDPDNIIMIVTYNKK